MLYSPRSAVSGRGIQSRFPLAWSYCKALYSISWYQWYGAFRTPTNRKTRDVMIQYFDNQTSNPTRLAANKTLMGSRQGSSLLWWSQITLNLSFADWWRVDSSLERCSTSYVSHGGCSSVGSQPSLGKTRDADLIVNFTRLTWTWISDQTFLSFTLKATATIAFVQWDIYNLFLMHPLWVAMRATCNWRPVTSESAEGK